MTLKICELISIVLLTFVSGMYWGPWLALSRSMATFKPEVFLVIVDRMNRNMGTLMTVVLPVALLSTVPVLFLSYNQRPETFYLTLAALALFVLTLIVTLIVEVPIVTQIVTWTVPTLPDNWRQLRNRWGKFHLARIVPSLAGLILLLVGAISKGVAEDGKLGWAITGIQGTGDWSLANYPRPFEGIQNQPPVAVRETGRRP